MGRATGRRPGGLGKLNARTGGRRPTDLFPHGASPWSLTAVCPERIPRQANQTDGSTVLATTVVWLQALQCAGSAAKRSLARLARRRRVDKTTPCAVWSVREMHAAGPSRGAVGNRGEPHGVSLENRKTFESGHPQDCASKSKTPSDTWKARPIARARRFMKRACISRNCGP